MVTAKKQVFLYVEGGGDSDSLRSECRRAFSSFLSKAGLSGKMPRIVACGSRNDAFTRFATSCLQSDKISVLLIDSEAPVSENCESNTDCQKWTPWSHLKKRDAWEKPENATEQQCHLMVECMENWFAADISALKQYYGQGFNDKKIPAVIDIEQISKNTIFSALDEATKNTKTKGKYSKGAHSFDLLYVIDSNLVITKSKWAKRFVDYLKQL